MAILSVEEFQESREAQQAGVANEAEEHITEAIANAEANLNLLLGYKVADEATSVTFNTSARLTTSMVPRKRVRSVSAITADGTSIGITDLTFDDFTLSNVYPFEGAVVVTGTFGFATTDDEYKIAKTWVLKAAVDELKQTKTSGAAIPYNAESITAEGVSLRFGPTRRPDMADLLKLLPKHPNARGSEGLFTISVGGAVELDPVVKAFAGLETTDDL